MATEITPSPIWSYGNSTIDNLRGARTFAHQSAYELSNGTLAFTVTADSVAGRQGLFSKDHTNFGDGGHLTVWIEDGRILARLQSQDQSYELTGGKVTAGEPLSVAVSFGSGGFELFVDGELVDRNDYTGGLEGNKEPIVIGASQWASSEQEAQQLTHEFKGTISDAALYDESLSAEAIRNLDAPAEDSTGGIVTEGLVAAYDDENVSLGAGNMVTGWLDGSGRGNDLVALGDPTQVAGATPTGRSAIVFDGTGDLLQRVNSTDPLNGLPGGNADRTMFFVVNYLDAEGVSSGLVYGDGEQNEAFGLGTKGNDNDLLLQGWGVSNDSDSDVDGPTQGWLVQSVVLSDGAFNHYQDGTLIDSGNHTFATDLQKLIIGGEIANLGESELGVAAGLIYDRALTETERQQVEAFLQEKYITGPSGSTNLPPEAVADTYSMAEATVLAVDDATGLLFNDSDPEGHFFEMTGVPDMPDHGTLSWSPNGSFTYIPDSGFVGTDSFFYQVSDGNGGTDQATVTIDVQSGGGGGPDEAPAPAPAPSNSAPRVVGSPVELSVTERDTGRVDLSNLFKDPDGDELNLSLKGAPGFVSINANDRLVATPKDGDDGSYSFSVFASDGDKNSPGLEVTLVVDDYVEEPPAGGGNAGGGNSYVPQAVTLTAGLGIMKAGVKGSQEWGKGVTLNGFDLNGNQAEVFTSNRWDDVGFGVKGPGSRWDDQIDYYASGGGRSEKMVVDFNGDVTDVVMRIGMLGATEGPRNTPETGTWKAYDSSGKMVDQGLIGPGYSALGKGVKEKGSYGLFPIEIDTTAAIERLELEATQFDYGKGSSTTMHYGENSSDYNLVGLEFLRTEPVDEFLF